LSALPLPKNFTTDQGTVEASLFEITKQGAQSLRMKMRNAALNLKEATVTYGLQPLAARLPELA